MQRKKNIRLLISLLAIIAATAVLFLFSPSPQTSFAEKNLFQIESLDKIDRVLLETPTSKTELKFNGSKWTVNDKFPADGQMITVLFATLKQTVAKRAIASSLRDSVAKAIVDHGVKVSCFEGGSLAREFRAGGNTEKTETYFVDHDNAPFLMTIPGYRVFIASIFELTPNDWRDKRVFNFNWQNIKDLEVSLPDDPRQSFKASFHSRFFSIDELATTDTTKLDAFMDALFQLRAKQILTDEQVKKMDTLFTRKQLERIVIDDIAGNRYALTLFQPSVQLGALPAMINDQFILLNPLAVKDLLHKRNYFIPPAN